MIAGRTHIHPVLVTDESAISFDSDGSQVASRGAVRRPQAPAGCRRGNHGSNADSHNSGSTSRDKADCSSPGENFPNCPVHIRAVDIHPVGRRAWIAGQEVAAFRYRAAGAR